MTSHMPLFSASILKPYLTLSMYPKISNKQKKGKGANQNTRSRLKVLKSNYVVMLYLNIRVRFDSKRTFTKLKGIYLILSIMVLCTCCLLNKEMLRFEIS